MKPCKFRLWLCLVIAVAMLTPEGFAQDKYISMLAQPDLLTTPTICLVTVNNNSKNVVQWDNLLKGSIAEVRIYKESTEQSNKWDLAGIVKDMSSSYFIDEKSEPLKQSNRYKISLADSCGNETDQSLHHKTMTLSILKSMNNSYSLIWDEYEGFPVSSYRIYRGYSVDDLKLIGSTASGNFNYNDNYVPIGQIFYQVEVICPYNCNSIIPKSAKAETAVVSAKSNLVSNMPLSLNSNKSGFAVQVSPNPVQNEVKIEFPNEHSEYTCKVYDMSGKVVLRRTTRESSLVFTTENLKSGVYSVELIGVKCFKGKFVICK